MRLGFLVMIQQTLHAMCRALLSRSAHLSTGAALLLAGCIPGAPSIEAPPEERLPDLAGRSLRVAAVPDLLPFSFRDGAGGDWVGFDVEAVRALSELLNANPQFVAVPREELLDRVAAREFDFGVGGISFTLDRFERLDYVGNYVVSYQRLVLRSDDDRISNVREAAALQDVLVGALARSTNEDAVRAFFGDEVFVGFGSPDEIVAALLAEQIDFAVLEDGELEVAELRNPGFLKAVPGVLRGEVLGFVFPKGTDLAPIIQSGFEELQRIGSVQTIAQRWVVDE